jgi:hypothetical protein
MKVNLSISNFKLYKMKKFLINILVGIILIFVLDFSIGLALSKLFNSQTSGNLYQLNYSFNECNEDLLIFGTSRALHHYDSRILRDSLNLSVYNTGKDGNFIFYQTALLRGVLKRYTPKKIILDFSGSFEMIQKDYDRIASLLPLYSSNPEISDIINLKSNTESFKLISKIYPYNSLVGNIIIGNLEFNKNRAANLNYYGYQPIYKNTKVKLEILNKKQTYEVDKTKQQIFEEFLILCKKNNIDLTVFYSPVYYLYDSNFSVKLCKKLCDKHEIPFYDYSKSDHFLENKKFFADKTHLNNLGAKEFTNSVINKIKFEKVKYLKN